MHRFVQHLWQNDSGQDLIEYALVAALVATGAVMLPQQINDGVQHAFSAVIVVLERLGNGTGNSGG
jgi:Flp pilus assembly pilin Flp